MSKKKIIILSANKFGITTDYLQGNLAGRYAPKLSFNSFHVPFWIFSILFNSFQYVVF